MSESLEAWLNRLRPRDYVKWGRYGAPTKLVCPDWLKKRYKRNCPRNAKQLIAEYGKAALDRS